MTAVKIIDGLYWVGAVDWNVRAFHGHTYNTQKGTTYNAYLVVDEKIALVDTVYGPFTADLIENIKEIIDPAKIDYIIANHVETDHSGALPAIHKLCPKAKVLGTQKCKEGLYKNYYGDWEFQEVKTGDKLSLGKKTLTFLEAPMLHWPDSMFTYMVEDAILLPNDAFGQHYASSQRFDDEVDPCFLMDEAAKYYANILLPFSPLVLRKIDEVQKANIPIKIIAPSHGIIWRKDPMKIVNAYVEWAKNTTKKKVVIVYETMWKSTEIMAKQIADGIIDSGGVDVKIYDVGSADKTDVIKEMLDAKGFLIGSSTHGNDMLPHMAGFLAFLKDMKPKGRLTAAFGSFGWAGGAVASIEKMLKESGIEVAQPGLGVKFVPDANEIKACYEFGREFAKKIGG
ncbi:MAG: MBL fold metallo-hydrolase [Elusimicrobia bacterium RIFOXYB2_FULL_48_7]|nr:MAG: MBL fold metallo-hydrolase [Elusimicrobia bacterium RIFOXYB2_FULL_48_7]